MKFLILIFPLFFSQCKADSDRLENESFVDYQVVPASYSSDSLLSKVQDKIYQSFVTATITKDAQVLETFDTALAQSYANSNHNLVQYWRAYLHYYLAIFYLQNNNSQKSESAIDKGIELISKMKGKNSEDYALLSLMQGFSIQFKGMKAMFIGPESKRNAKKAIELDEKNLRAYFVYASNDFYTPAQYGGGKEAEEYILKAVVMPSQATRNDYLPSWGKEEAYEMLVKLYLQKENWEAAKKYWQEAHQAFPNSYLINQLVSELINK